MGCPHYEGNTKCGFHPLSYVLTSQHILSNCVAKGDAYTSCSEFIQLSPRKTSDALRPTVLEMKAIEEEDENPMATFEGHDDPIVQAHLRAQERLNREPSEERDLTARLYPGGWF